MIATEQNEGLSAQNEFVGLSRLTETVGRISIEASSEQEMLQLALNAVCIFFAWPAGCVFIKTSEATACTLMPDVGYALGDIDQLAVNQTSEQITKSVRTRVLDNKRIDLPILSDQATDPTLPKQSIIIPIQSRELLLGCLVCFFEPELRPDNYALRTLAQIGIQLGTVIGLEQSIRHKTQELEQEKTNLLQVTGNMHGGGILFDADGEVVFVNTKARELLGLDAKAPQSAVLPAFFAAFNEVAIEEKFKKMLAGESFDLFDVESSHRIFQIFFHVLKKHTVSKNTEQNYFIFINDVTEETLLERAKSELIAVASHQLRTPLTAVRGDIELLEDESFGPVNPQQKELLVEIETSTKRLINMVNEMLDITQIEKGELEMNKEDIDLLQTIDSIKDELKDLAGQKAVAVTDEKPDKPIVLSGDKVRVRQVFQNLIDNAIKYSKPEGTVAIAYELSSKSLLVTVKDDGIGIPKKEQSEIFGRFYRATNAQEQPGGSSGLGLYIVKSIVEQMGGSIRFESEENVGTTFFITLPYPKHQVD